MSVWQARFGIRDRVLETRWGIVHVGQIAPGAAFIVAHVVLALGMRAVPLLGLVHALASVVAGVAVAARRPLHQTAYVVAYLAGAEVLWRMTRAGVFWEFGKYAVAIVTLVAFLRIRHRPRLRHRELALVYFALLLPSSLLTLIAFDVGVARQYISFNLSGPLSLALCVLLFSNLRLTNAQLRTAFVALIGPVVGIAALAYVSTASAVDLQFASDSNSVTSGGFGPNQVAAVLGLGLLFALLIAMERHPTWKARAPWIVIAIVLAAQAALTFSRGGLAIAFASAFIAVLYLIRDRRTRLTLMVVGALLYGVATWFVVPRLDAFTQGKLVERYTSLTASNRDVLASLDLAIFADNVALGVGPGVAGVLRKDLGGLSAINAAHTEYTRVLAEHGLLGAAAMFLLVVLAIRLIYAAATVRTRALVLALLAWSSLFMLINAMRLAAPSVVVGLACAIAFASRETREDAPRA